MNSTIKNIVILGTIATILGGVIAPIQAQSQDVKFICNKSYEQSSKKAEITTFIWTPRGKIRLVQWVKKVGGYPPQERCKEVSQRLQTLHNNGKLNLTLITNGKSKGKKVICTAKESGAKCDNLIMTLENQDNSLDILNQFKDILNGLQVGPIKHSAGEPQIYYQVNFDNFIKNAPVEK
ncbi:MAG TPA: COP23 domain-containing protein [Allocoleopsis sp.]